MYECCFSSGLGADGVFGCSSGIERDLLRGVEITFRLSRRFSLSTSASLLGLAEPAFDFEPLTGGCGLVAGLCAIPLAFDFLVGFGAIEAGVLEETGSEDLLGIGVPGVPLDRLLLAKEALLGVDLPEPPDCRGPGTGMPDFLDMAFFSMIV